MRVAAQVILALAGMVAGGGLAVMVRGIWRYWR
jgi:hypothetical protein